MVASTATPASALPETSSEAPTAKNDCPHNIFSKLFPSCRRASDVPLSPGSTSKSTRATEPSSKFKMLAFRSNLSSRRSRPFLNKGMAAAGKEGGDRFGGIRSSTSTYLTETARSSMFLVEPSGFLGMSSAEDQQQLPQEADPIVEGENVVDVVQEEERALPFFARPLRRTPAPESYYKLTKNKHKELGYLEIEYDSVEEAQEEAARREQPILCIEAEVPGDVHTGETIFSHPLIVEAAASLFVTVRPAPEEPQDDHSRFFGNSSCRTRVRVLDEEGMDVIPCLEHMSAAEVVGAMVEGLETHYPNKPVPRYLMLLLEEASGQLQKLSKTRFRETEGVAVFGMFDSKLSEVELAGLDGVLSTRAGVVTRQKVVRLTYDTRRLSYCALVRYALRHAAVNIVYYVTNEERRAAQMEAKRHEECLQRRREQRQEEEDSDTEDASAGGEETTTFVDPTMVPIKVTEQIGNMRATQNPKPALRDSILRFVPLTDLQACKANRLIHLNRFNEAMHLLSPRQGFIAMQAVRYHYHDAFQDVVDVPIDIAWTELSQVNEAQQRCPQ